MTLPGGGVAFFWKRWSLHEITSNQRLILERLHTLVDTTLIARRKHHINSHFFSLGMKIFLNTKAAFSYPRSGVRAIPAEDRPHKSKRGRLSTKFKTQLYVRGRWETSYQIDNHDPLQCKLRRSEWRQPHWPSVEEKQKRIFQTNL